MTASSSSIFCIRYCFTASVTMRALRNNTSRKSHVGPLRRSDTVPALIALAAQRQSAYRALPVVQSPPPPLGAGSSYSTESERPHDVTTLNWTKLQRSTRRLFGSSIVIPRAGSGPATIDAKQWLNILKIRPALPTRRFSPLGYATCRNNPWVDITAHQIELRDKGR